LPLKVLFLIVFPSIGAYLFTQALFLLLFKSFSNVLTNRLPKGSGARTLREWKSTQVEEMAVDPEESSTMELDNENQIPQNRFRVCPYLTKIDIAQQPNYYALTLAS